MILLFNDTVQKKCKSSTYCEQNSLVYNNFILNRWVICVEKYKMKLNAFCTAVYISGWSSSKCLFMYTNSFGSLRGQESFLYVWVHSFLSLNFWIWLYYFHFFETKVLSQFHCTVMWMHWLMLLFHMYPYFFLTAQFILTIWLSSCFECYITNCGSINYVF